MAHLDAMLERLPQLYRDGELVHAFMAVPGVQQELIDEALMSVQRAHVFDRALERDEVVGLAHVLGFEPEPWQDRDEYRVWVHALRNAMLREGAVTVEALQGFIAEYSARYQAVSGIRAVPQIVSWSDSPGPEPALIENPRVRRVHALASDAPVEPLHQGEVTQRGLDETTVDFLVVGLPDAPEYAPAFVNTTTGQGLVFTRPLAVGKRLWIGRTEGGPVEARIEGEDLSQWLYSIAEVAPGEPWELSEQVSPAQPITLARGDNGLWFFPLAHFDRQGLDRFLLALPDLALQQGRFDQSRFDEALFYQDPAIKAWACWQETRPASFRVELPGGTLVSRSGRLDEALEDRDRLEFSLELATRRLRAAGVESSVSLVPLHDAQPQQDRLVAISPMRIADAGSVGSDRQPDSGGLFGVTDYDDSTFR